MEQSRLSLAVKNLIADTVAYLLYSIPGGLITLYFETAVIGLTLQQWGGIRVWYTILRIAGARVVLGKLDNVIRYNVAGPKPNRFQKSVADTITLIVYQLPLYALTLWIMDASSKQLMMACAFSFVENTLLGWLYGLVLDLSRRLLARNGR